ncbi:M48 family metallopeptidase [Gynuella sunshinyii]|uniref:Putative Zn-dependent protease, contains TPR repeats n=1 Tax=Gynuella sunshinyii YC6258 TaxID=1445510 RepID=A0A0C5VHZ9_9GAMM|nr:M48 family metallopeptidase [Gynuella sunshinyii]AJQ92998.1 putative Zn-dependent protease, contains TPR repeats [Gynuella sunshinyii YC6258]
MSYENPKIPEGINVSKQQPLLEFAQLTIMVFGGIALVLALLMFSAGYLAKFLPFSWEVRLAHNLRLEQLSDSDERYPQRQQSLQQLSDTLAAAMDFSDAMSISPHWLESEQLNAFATLGGQVFLFSELVEQLDSEQALAMVLAHEIAHVRLRHPIRNLAGGATVQLVLALLGNQQGLNSVGALGVMGYSRRQEQEADILALTTVQRVYGNVSGALDFYQQMTVLQAEPPQWLSTHPATADRIRVLTELIRERHWLVGDELKLPIPDVYFSESTRK